MGPLYGSITCEEDEAILVHHYPIFWRQWCLRAHRWRNQKAMSQLQNEITCHRRSPLSAKLHVCGDFLDKEKWLKSSCWLQFWSVSLATRHKIVNSILFGWDRVCIVQLKVPPLIASFNQKHLTPLWFKYVINFLVYLICPNWVSNLSLILTGFKFFN